ncbi:hypothetical protein ARMSODRAFT_977845 [Armillaria solidipes]|uniref:Histone-lysine N-methyltransferase, H3 lysine-79 specific n=1 Tax=Armillaria solidipes TaxID=1076256 RepID=A0A2H3B959_9AGAR|nr:hypothetical protein ARMSODRAFT_977845 [Armillaria solidipes]
MSELESTITVLLRGTTALIIEEVEMHDGEHETSALQNMLAPLKHTEKNHDLQAYLEEVGRHVAHIQQAPSILFDDSTYQHIIEAGYSRVVKPHHCSLKKYKVGIGPHSTFVDLGSGVGNVCSQISLKTGCKCYEQICVFSYIWGYEHKGQVDLHHGDMRTNGTTMPAIREADIIYINNFKFELSYIVNQEIRQILAASDLCDGVKIFAFELLAVFIDVDLITQNWDDIMNFCYVEKAQKYPTLTGEYTQWSDQTITLHLHIVDRQ